jgi:hypothetical protein
MASVKKVAALAAAGVIALLVAAGVSAAPPGLGAAVFSVYSASTANCSGIPCIWANSTSGKIKFRNAAGVDRVVGEADLITSAASDPGTPVPGQCYYNTSTFKIRCYQGAAWVNWGDGGTPGSVTFNQVKAALAAASSSVGFNSQSLTGINAAAVTSLTIGGAPAEAVFSRTCTLTSAAAATPVNCLADADVPTGKAVHLLGWHAKVNGATAWATTASCYIADTSGAGGTGLIFVTAAVAALTGNAFVSDASANVTQGSVYALNTGGTTAKGLQIACDGNGTGSNLVITVFGVIK